MREIEMVKSCCVVDCHNLYKKKSGISFHRFPRKVNRRERWIAAVRRENWMPNKSTWICSQHFITGKKSNNPLAPNYVPSIFPYTASPIKRKLEGDAIKFERRQATKLKRLQANKRKKVRAVATRRRLQDTEGFGEPLNDTESNEASQGQADECSSEEINSTTDSNVLVAGADSEECPKCCELKMQCSKYQQERDELQKVCEKYQWENEKLRKKVVDDEFLQIMMLKQNITQGYLPMSYSKLFLAL